MMVMNATTVAVVPVPLKFWRMTDEPVVLSKEILVGFEVMFTMQVVAVSCPVAALVCRVC